MPGVLASASPPVTSRRRLGFVGNDGFRLLAYRRSNDDFCKYFHDLARRIRVEFTVERDNAAKG